jgi:hypothetical protein
MFKLLAKPFPADFSLKRISFHALIAFSVVFFILFFLAPFRMNLLPVYKRFTTSLCFAMVCPLVIYPIDYTFSRVFTNFYKESSWNIGKQICNTLLIVVGITIGNALMSNMIFNQPLNTSTFIGFLSYVLLIGVFPIVIGVFYTQYTNQKKFIQLSKVANEPLALENVANSQVVGSNDSQITLHGQNSDELLHLQLIELLFMEAADNYVEIHYFQEVQKKVLFRSTLNLLHQQIASFDGVVKCHRSFIVNKASIVSTEGNAQGLKLILKNCTSSIPVSRSLSKLFL